MVVRGKLNLRADAGGAVRVFGTWVLGACDNGAGGHIKGVTFEGQGEDSIRVEGGTWSFHNCIICCNPSPSLSCSALLVQSGKVFNTTLSPRIAHKLAHIRLKCTNTLLSSKQADAKCEKFEYLRRQE